MEEFHLSERFVRQTKLSSIGPLGAAIGGIVIFAGMTLVVLAMGFPERESLPPGIPDIPQPTGPFGIRLWVWNRVLVLGVGLIGLAFAAIHWLLYKSGKNKLQQAELSIDGHNVRHRLGRSKWELDLDEVGRG
ncbi:MAG: hypothetical protein HY706_15720 [Candidatus Hydrogenedentes bacterium]|nr:hypothetical protein [Candidatus Hydrogenedentota bacterium]